MFWNAPGCQAALIVPVALAFWAPVAHGQGALAPIAQEAYLKARGIVPLNQFTITFDSRQGPTLTRDDTDPA